jgi:hypothetical protein
MRAGLTGVARGCAPSSILLRPCAPGAGAFLFRIKLSIARLSGSTLAHPVRERQTTSAVLHHRGRHPCRTEREGVCRSGNAGVTSPRLLWRCCSAVHGKPQRHPAPALAAPTRAHRQRRMGGAIIGAIATARPMTSMATTGRAHRLRRICGALHFTAAGAQPLTPNS